MYNLIQIHENKLNEWNGYEIRHHLDPFLLNKGRYKLIGKYLNYDMAELALYSRTVNRINSISSHFV